MDIQLQIRYPDRKPPSHTTHHIHSTPWLSLLSAHPPVTESPSEASSKITTTASTFSLSIPIQ
uniref:Mutant protein of TTG1 n=1 Tax=Arabidopsis thaliana TaxID=3702 RepID=Q5DWW8_ARATH|nr:mutant protein of TTG1 [Arabidopsis thaliana]